VGLVIRFKKDFENINSLSASIPNAKGAVGPLVSFLSGFSPGLAVSIAIYRDTSVD